MALTAEEKRALLLKPKAVEVDGLKTTQHSLKDVLDANDRIAASEAQCTPAQRVRSMMSRFVSVR